MNRKTSLGVFATALIAVVAVAGCKKQDAPAPAPSATPAPASTSPAPAPAASVRIVAVELGKGLADDKRVAEAVTVFAPRDTIHASVNTEGDGNGKKLAARWTFQDGAQVHDESVDMAGSNSIYAFKLSNTNPWPVGTYKVEISLDGQALESREFQVK